MGIIVLFILPYNRYFAYHLLKDDCYNHASWTHDRIFINPVPVDVAFFGSSRTIHAIWEDKIEEKLNRNLQDSIHLLNLGYCRLGRNLQLVLLKDLLKTKSPGMIIMEVRARENRYSHPVFPHLAETNEVLKPVVFYNRDIFSDFYLALISRLEYIRSLFFGSIDNTQQPDLDTFGYGASSDTANFQLLNDSKINKMNKYKNISNTDNFHNRYPHKYLERIHHIAEGRNIKMVFLFVPSYGLPITQPINIELYQEMGEVWIPPHEIFSNPNNWMDTEHLNDNGAKEMSYFIAERLRDTFLNRELPDNSN
ncbi:MAG: hypothetical protein JW731_11600 [Bacteroidales bacterium]|nr:hypothetical protein [Bacteroidales bacterium]